MNMTTVTARVALCFLAAIMPALTGCSRPPAITFLEVPPASFGGSGSTGLIRGRVSGNHRGRHIVVYAFADSRWWVQPFASAPRTDIADDGTWKAKIHLGTEYAAVMTKDDSLPAPFMETLPPVGKAVEAIATVKGNGDDLWSNENPASGTILRFSGLEWKVRTMPGDYGSKTNEYSAGNVFVDDAGALHMRLTRNAQGRNAQEWVCSEVHSVRSLGYGTYTLNILDAGHLEPAVMFSAFTFFEHPRDGDHRELTIHLTRRGVASNTNAEFSIQPSFVPTNFYHFDVPSGPLKLDVNWSREEARFSVARAVAGAVSKMTVASWLFNTGVPIPDDTHLYINFCNYGYAPAPPTHNAEVVVKTFEFYP